MVTLKLIGLILKLQRKLSYVNTVPGVNITILFCCKFTHSFLKAISFHNTKNNGYFVAKAWLTKSMSKFTPKKSYETYHSTEAFLLIKSPCLAAALGVTESFTIIAMNLVALTKDQQSGL